MSNNAAFPNAQRLLWAGFFSILAAGVGFSIRAGILGDWAKEFGFTQAELGGITGGGLTGFGVIILLGSAIADKVGYGRLMVFAFVMHIVSALLQMCTAQVNAIYGREGVYWTLFVAMFVFSVANGVCEAVVNPMVATLFPKQKTHYLNILHAGWPGGLIIGGLLSYFMNDGTIGTWAPLGKVHWLIQMSMFLIPTLIYGGMLVGQKFPKSEAGEAGVSYGTMLLEFLSPVLILLLIIHAMVGYVELGTDSWIAKITGSIMQDPKRGLLLFVYTSGLMFALRFFAGPIEHKLSPLGLLLASAIFAAAGLTFLGAAEGVLFCVIAATVYGIGKTFFWPTMLAVVSERFPKGGALTIGAIGGAGMLSAGLLGGPGIGHKQDYFASQQLKETEKDTYERYAVEKEKTFYGFLPVKGLDGTKVAILELQKQILDTTKQLEDSNKKPPAEEAQKLERQKADVQEELKKTFENEPNAKRKQELTSWWKTAEPHASKDAGPIETASLYGGRQALKWTATVPAAMALLYLLLILYFKARGGYKPVVIETSAAPHK